MTKHPSPHSPPSLKGIVSVISSDLQCKDCFSCQKYESHFRREPANENKLKETKTWISNSYLTRQSLLFQVIIFAWMVTWNHAYSSFYPWTRCVCGGGCWIKNVNPCHIPRGTNMIPTTMWTQRTESLAGRLEIVVCPKFVWSP